MNYAMTSTTQNETLLVTNLVKNMF